MGPFSITCLSCGRTLKVRDASLVGKQARCPNCRDLVLVVHPGSGAEQPSLAELAAEEQSLLREAPGTDHPPPLPSSEQAGALDASPPRGGPSLSVPLLAVGSAAAGGLIVALVLILGGSGREDHAADAGETDVPAVADASVAAEQTVTENPDGGEQHDQPGAPVAQEPELPLEPTPAPTQASPEARNDADAAPGEVPEADGEEQNENVESGRVQRADGPDEREEDMVLPLLPAALPGEPALPRATAPEPAGTEITVPPVPRASGDGEGDLLQRYGESLASDEVEAGEPERPAPAHGPAQAPVPPTGPEPELDLDARLDLPIRELSFPEPAAVGEVLRLLDEMRALSLEYDEAILAQRSVDLESPVAIDMQATTAREILDRILEPLALTYVVEQQRVVIVPADE